MGMWYSYHNASLLSILLGLLVLFCTYDGIVLLCLHPLQLLFDGFHCAWFPVFVTREKEEVDTVTAAVANWTRCKTAEVGSSLYSMWSPKAGLPHWGWQLSLQDPISSLDVTEQFYFWSFSVFRKRRCRRTLERSNGSRVWFAAGARSR